MKSAMVFVAVIISTILFWATSNVCKYNFAVEKRTNILNVITEEIDPTIPKAKIYYYKELNCADVELDWDIDRVIKNLEAISVIIYQELTTDIRGEPL
jgi:hypothetical protein|tara:strand:+ start:614 stop:907 length:294 start_codon:yes stop_codon:yes gene_type:complete